MGCAYVVQKFKWSSFPADFWVSGIKVSDVRRILVLFSDWKVEMVASSVLLRSFREHRTMQVFYFLFFFFLHSLPQRCFGRTNMSASQNKHDEFSYTHRHQPRFSFIFYFPLLNLFSHHLIRPLELVAWYECVNRFGRYACNSYFSK